MAYRRNYRRKSNRRYPRRGNGSTDYIKMARTAYRGVKYIKSMINAEKKSIDLTPAIFPQNNTPFIFFTTGVSTGTDETNRDGRSILLKSIYIRSLLIRGAVDSVCRIIVFIDKAPNGVLPTASDLLTGTSGPGWVLTTLNQDNAGSRFKVIADKMVTLSAGSSTTKEVTIFRKLNHHAKYDGITNNISDATTGHVFVLYVSNVSAAGDSPQIQSSYRAMFYDN